MKKTGWFDGKVKPALPGVYEREEPAAFVGSYSHFDGKKWGVSAKNSEIAFSRRHLSSVWQDLAWRGLASDPSKAGSKA